jgi:hypothetical protein
LQDPSSELVAVVKVSLLLPLGVPTKAEPTSDMILTIGAISTWNAKSPTNHDKKSSLLVS